ncbi:hypothetical protein GCM10009603_47220 [Nocardiopsis exhalans]
MEPVGSVLRGADMSGSFTGGRTFTSTLAPETAGYLPNRGGSASSASPARGNRARPE